MAAELSRRKGETPTGKTVVERPAVSVSTLGDNSFAGAKTDAGSNADLNRLNKLARRVVAATTPTPPGDRPIHKNVRTGGSDKPGDDVAAADKTRKMAAHNENRTAISRIVAHLPPEYDLSEVLVPSRLAVLPLLATDPAELSNNDLLGLGIRDVSTLARRVLGDLKTKLPPDMLPQDLPEPAVEVKAIDPKTFGGKLDGFKIAADMTDAQLTAATDLSPSTLHRIFHNEVASKPNDIAALLDAMGVDPEIAKPLIDQAKIRYSAMRSRRRIE